MEQIEVMQLIGELLPKQNSVELSRNAKGAYSWVIKVYEKDLDILLVRIKTVDEKLKTSYNGGATNGTENKTDVSQ